VAHEIALSGAVETAVGASKVPACSSNACPALSTATHVVVPTGHETAVSGTPSTAGCSVQNEPS